VNAFELDFSWLADEDDLETVEMPASRAHHRTAARRLLRRALQEEAVAEILPELPGPGESVHIIANGKYDFWLYVPHMLGLLGTPARLWASTWTMNRGNVLELLELYDQGSLTAITILTGLYFKRRESAVYATLLEGIQARGQRYLALKNHAKLILLEAAGAHLVVEGSANFTANPRIEQYVITHDEQLLRFHASWIDEAVEGRHG